MDPDGILPRIAFPVNPGVWANTSKVAADEAPDVMDTGPAGNTTFPLADTLPVTVIPPGAVKPPLETTNPFFEIVVKPFPRT